MYMTFPLCRVLDWWVAFQIKMSVCFTCMRPTCTEIKIEFQLTWCSVWLRYGLYSFPPTYSSFPFLPCDLLILSSFPPFLPSILPWSCLPFPSSLLTFLQAILSSYGPPYPSFHPPFPWSSLPLVFNSLLSPSPSILPSILPLVSWSWIVTNGENCPTNANKIMWNSYLAAGYKQSCSNWTGHFTFESLHLST